MDTNTNETLKRMGEDYLARLPKWLEAIPTTNLNVVRAQATPAIISVDMVKGFCTVGPLASPRIQAIAQPVANHIARADALDYHVALVQEWHHPETPEFSSFPPHCIAGSEEAETIPEIKGLARSFFWPVVLKNSLHGGIGTAFDSWLARFRSIDTFVVVGNCTDLCVYQMAMYLRLTANAYNIRRRVIVPANLVQTYDLPVAVADQIGATPHDGDLAHLTFLHHMHLNGIEIVNLEG